MVIFQLIYSYGRTYTEHSSSSFLFNLSYCKDFHCFSQARHIAHSKTQCRHFVNTIYFLHSKSTEYTNSAL